MQEMLREGHLSQKTLAQVKSIVRGGASATDHLEGIVTSGCKSVRAGRMPIS
jgi:hypothetical protein